MTLISEGPTAPGTLPDLRGFTGREALLKLSQLGLDVSLSGTVSSFLRIRRPGLPWTLSMSVGLCSTGFQHEFFRVHPANDVDELRGALRKAGLHRIDEGVAADTGALFVTGLAWDSRAVEPGNVFIALKGLRADGNPFAPRRSVAVLSRLCRKDRHRPTSMSLG